MNAFWRKRGTSEGSSDLVEQARAAERAQSWDEAGRHWAALRHAEPQERAAWIGEATALRAKGDAQAAFNLLKTAPHDFNQQFDFAATLAALGDIEGIDPTIKRWIALGRRFPFVAQAFVVASNLLLATSRFEEAELVIAHGLKEHPCDIRLLKSAVDTAVRLGNWPQACVRLARVEFAFRDDPFTRDEAPALRVRIDRELADLVERRAALG